MRGVYAEKDTDADGKHHCIGTCRRARPPEGADVRQPILPSAARGRNQTCGRALSAFNFQLSAFWSRSCVRRNFFAKCKEVTDKESILRMTGDASFDRSVTIQ
jgi:hypothetical protein